MSFRILRPIAVALAVVLLQCATSSAQLVTQSSRSRTNWKWSASLGASYGETLGRWFEPSNGGQNIGGACNFRIGHGWGLRLHLAQGLNSTGELQIPVYDQFGFVGMGKVNSEWRTGRYALGIFGQILLNRNGVRTDHLYTNIGFGIMTAQLKSDQGVLDDGTPFVVLTDFDETYPLLELSSGIVVQVSGPFSVEIGGDISLVGVRGAFTPKTDDDIDAGYVSVGVGITYLFLRQPK